MYSASDIWALGCTILEMLTGRQPFHEVFDGLDPFQIYVKIGKMKDIPPLPKNISEYLRDLLLRCFKMFDIFLFKILTLIGIQKKELLLKSF